MLCPRSDADATSSALVALCCPGTKEEESLLASALTSTLLYGALHCTAPPGTYSFALHTHPCSPLQLGLRLPAQLCNRHVTPQLAGLSAVRKPGHSGKLRTFSLSVPHHKATPQKVRKILHSLGIAGSKAQKELSGAGALPSIDL